VFRKGNTVHIELRGELISFFEIDLSTFDVLFSFTKGISAQVELKRGL